MGYYPDQEDSRKDPDWWDRLEEARAEQRDILRDEEAAWDDPR